MYLSKNELDSLLKQKYFSTFLHTNVTKYALYRGHYNANVLTLRYSVLSPSFTENDMIQSCINEAMKFFPAKQKLIRGLIEYDFVLKASGWGGACKKQGGVSVGLLRQAWLLCWLG